jgi:hypothetical protein
VLVGVTQALTFLLAVGVVLVVIVQALAAKVLAVEHLPNLNCQSLQKLLTL